MRAGPTQAETWQVAGAETRPCAGNTGGGKRRSVLFLRKVGKNHLFMSLLIVFTLTSSGATNLNVSFKLSRVQFPSLPFMTFVSTKQEEVKTRKWFVLLVPSKQSHVNA